MLMAELTTAVRYQLPIRIVILKNNSLGMIRWEQMVFLGNPEFGCDLSPINFTEVARACGASGFRIEDPSHIGFLVYPAFAIVKRRNQRHLRESEERQRAIVSNNIRQTNGSVLMRALMDLETLAGRFLRYPVGIRCVFTAIKA